MRFCAIRPRTVAVDDLDDLDAVGASSKIPAAF
jgi:hypothetical protein